MKRIIAAVALLLSNTASAGATQIPVGYSVDFKEFKKVEAGAPLDFQVFTDSACTQLAHAATLFAGDSALRQSKVLVQKVKGQSPKPPLEMRLAATLDPVSPLASAFLMVTGDHVVPVGGACQAQFSVPQGAAVPPHVVMVDDEGDLVGQMWGEDYVIINVPGVPHTLLQLRFGQLTGGGVLYYESADCTGQPLMQGHNGAFGRGAHYNGLVLLYVPPTTVTSYTVQSRSLSHERDVSCLGGAPLVPPAGCCDPVTPFASDFGLPTVYDLSHVLYPTAFAVE